MVIVSEGYKFIGAALILAVILGFFAHPYAAIPFVVLACYFAYFFRSPAREIVQDVNHILSPADGTVTKSSIPTDEISVTVPSAGERMWFISCTISRAGLRKKYAK